MPASVAILGGATVRTGRRRDERPSAKKNLQFADYVDDQAHFLGLPTYAHHAYGIPSASLGMMGNDALGDCTCAALGHAVHTWSIRDGLADARRPTDADVIDGLYWKTGKADDGRMMRDVLDYWMANPLASMPSPLAYVEVDASKASHVRRAIALFGNAYIGLWLPVAAQTMTTWEISSTQKLTGDYEPGGWGGHAINLPSYSDSRVEYGGITWGERIGVGQSFLRAYCDEMYAIIHPYWLNANESPAGFDLDSLKADLAKLQAA